MKEIPIFVEKIYEFDYEDHYKYQRQFVSMIKSGTIDNSLNHKMKNKLIYSRPDLHVLEEFKPITEFMNKCITDTMFAMGYVPDIKINSMWSTYQKQNQFHHYHTHVNTFLAAVYYLYCKNPKLAKGTIFHNTNYPKYSSVTPKLNRKVPRVTQSKYELNFVPGKVYVFPACIPHMTAPNEDEERIIIGMNTMPLGFANDDQFDKYEYK
jgi:hypothetical protein